MNDQPHADQKLIMLAPMAGITDRPFRGICRELGADACVTEMLSANPAVYRTRKSEWRRDIEDEAGPRIVQIAGADPVLLADAARFNIDAGAEVIDINMGCPAKKVCNNAAGSALLRDEALVARILEAVVAASSVPVTLKIRTGWDREHRNAVAIARIAEASGIARLTVHGRTRADRFEGRAEHDTVAKVKSLVRIPVIANGDISSADEAARVLAHTGCDGVMIGRAATGNPWLFAEVRALLSGNRRIHIPTPAERLALILRHLSAIHDHYGEQAGVRIARKHIHAYSANLSDAVSLRRELATIESAARQIACVQEFFARAERHQAGTTRLAA